MNLIRLLLLIALAAGGAGLCWGHHFKGLPHFNYFENYPQVPQEEYLWQEGEYEFSLVLYDFQGLTQEDKEQPENVKLYLVVYSLRDNGVYNGPATVDIRDGGRVMTEVSFPAATEESIYSLEHTLPETGRYSLGVRIDGPQGVNAEIPFKLSSQKVPWGRWVTAGILGLVLIVAVGSRRARIMRDRKQLSQQRRRAVRPKATVS